ncbi:MAG: hypothetical protein HY645_05305 [Acidobacteria bacterium]|nr:hypothetical protein [Acidobacteriota bacterium]
MSPLLLLIPLFFIALILYMALPLLSEVTGRASVASTAGPGLEPRKEALLRELNDIEMEYLTDKLSEEDFRDLYQNCEQELITVLRTEKRKW